jgi:membrane protein
VAVYDDSTRGGQRMLTGALIATGLALYGAVTRRQERRRLETLAHDPTRTPRDHLGRDAAVPSEIPARGWWEIMKRVWEQMGTDNISTLSAGVAFWGLLSLFPALSALVSLFGLVADPHTVQQQLAQTAGVLPQDATKLISEQLNTMAANPSKLGIGLVVSVGIALWTARSGTGMIMTALNVAYDEKETRNFIWFNIHAYALTAGLVLFGILAIAFVAVLPAVLSFLDLPTSWSIVIQVIRWLALAALVVLALAILYRFGPSRERPRWQWVSWGALVAAVLWLAASAAFSYYVGHFGGYDKTYGSLAAVVIVLLWFYITAYVVLIGAELNAEMEHQTARDTTTRPERPLGARGARMADTVARPTS